MKRHRTLVGFLFAAAIALQADADTQSVLRSGSTPSLAEFVASLTTSGSPSDRDALRKRICSLEFTSDRLSNLVRTFFPELGFQVIESIDGYLEMIEEGCGDPILYDPVGLMAVACEEHEKTRLVRNAGREIERCAKVEELAQRLHTLKPKPRYRFENGQVLVNDASCRDVKDLLHELAHLLGIRRDRLARLHLTKLYFACDGSDENSDIVKFSECYLDLELALEEAFQKYEECKRRWLDSILYPRGGVVFFFAPFAPQPDLCKMVPDLCKSPVPPDLCKMVPDLCKFPDPHRHNGRKSEIPEFRLPMMPKGLFGNDDGVPDWDGGLDRFEEKHNPMGGLDPNGAVEYPYSDIGGFDVRGYGLDPNLLSGVRDGGHR